MRTLNQREINALYRSASSDNLRPEIMGAYHENGKIIVTDGHQLIAIDANYDPELEGKIIKKNGDEVKGKFPNWKGVIPSNVEPLNIDIEQVYEACKRIKGASKRAKYTPDTRLLIENRTYSAERLYNILDVLRNFDDTSFHHDPVRDAGIALIKSDGFMALLMPMFISGNNRDLESEIKEINKGSIDETGYPAIFTIEEAMKFERFKKVVIGSHVGYVYSGEVIGQFEKNGRVYDIVLEDSRRGGVHAVIDRVSQEWAPFRGYGDYERLIERVDTSKVLTVDWTIPDKVRTKVKHVDNGVVKEVNAKISDVHKYRDMEFYVTHSGNTFAWMVYKGYKIQVLTEPTDQYFERMNAMENPKAEIEQFITNTYSL